MIARVSSHLGDQEQGHPFNFSEGTGPGLMEIEKRRLWLP
jgi:hypothetical protein